MDRDVSFPCTSHTFPHLRSMQRRRGEQPPGLVRGQHGEGSGGMLIGMPGGMPGGERSGGSGG